MLFHICFHTGIILSSVWVAEWPPFWEGWPYAHDTLIIKSSWHPYRQELMTPLSSRAHDPLIIKSSWRSLIIKSSWPPYHQELMTPLSSRAHDPLIIKSSWRSLIIKSSWTAYHQELMTPLSSRAHNPLIIKSSWRSLIIKSSWRSLIIKSSWPPYHQELMTVPYHQELMKVPYHQELMTPLSSRAHNPLIIKSSWPLIIKSSWPPYHQEFMTPLSSRALDTWSPWGECCGLVVNASDTGSRGRGFEPHSGQTVLCPWARGIYSPKVLVIPRKRWLRPNMTEKLFTGTSRINQPTIMKPLSSIKSSGSPYRLLGLM